MLQELLDRLFSRGTSQKTSRETVKHRLKILLAHDRTDLSPAMVERMRQEIIEVVSRYVEIDTNGAEFLLESDQRSTALIANLPIRGIKSEAHVESPPNTAPNQPAAPEPPKPSSSAATVADSPKQPAETTAPTLSDDDLSPDLDLWLDAIEAPLNAKKSSEPPAKAPDGPSNNQPPSSL